MAVETICMYSLISFIFPSLYPILDVYHFRPRITILIRWFIFILAFLSSLMSMAATGLCVGKVFITQMLFSLSRLIFTQFAFKWCTMRCVNIKGAG